MKTLQGLLGYRPQEVAWGPLRVFCEVETGGECADGFTHNETLGVGQNEFGNLVIFRASIDSAISDQVAAITLSDKVGEKDLPDLLRELAAALELNL